MLTTLESQIPLSDLNKGLRPEQSRRGDSDLELGNNYNEIEMKTFSKFPIEILEFHSESKWATNSDYKTNSLSHEMSNSEYRQTSIFFRQ